MGIIQCIWDPVNKKAATKWADCAIRGEIGVIKIRKDERRGRRLTYMPEVNFRGAIGFSSLNPKGRAAQGAIPPSSHDLVKSVF